MSLLLSTSDGKESEPSKNEPNPNPKSKKKCARTKQNPNTNELKCHGSYWVLSLKEIVDTFTHFTVNEEFYFT